LTGFFVKSLIRSCLAAAAFCSVPMAAHADWQAVEQVQTYPVAGTTPVEIYLSIGERGPKLGSGRVIAHTTFRLTWTRDYQRQGNACVLASAKPKLTIIYTIPKPEARLSAPVQARWDIFISGVRKHEATHGDFVKNMVDEIEAASVGLTVPNDPDCRKIRTELTKRLGPISNKKGRRDAEFDRTEMSEGGKVRKMVLEFVSGGEGGPYSAPRF
jgi:predicted secreted Zn-dependent protease